MRRLISVASVSLAVVALLVLLLNATLVDRRAPAVTAIALSAPVEGQAAVAQTLTAIDVQFSEPVRTFTAERRFRIEPYVAGTITWDGSTATFTPSERLPPDTEFRVTIEPGFEDLAGNVSTSGADLAFRTVGPPVVAEVDPADGATGVSVDAPVTLTFDRLMDTGAVEAAIRVEPAIGVRPSWSGRTLTLGFDGPLQFGTTYAVTVDAAASDTDGTRLRRPFRSEFTTVEAALRVVETMPRDGVAGISVRTPIAVVFDAPIDPESAREALSITPSVGGDVRFVALPDDRVPRADAGSAEPTVLLLQPSEPLAAHTTYTVSLAPVVARAGAPEQVATGRTFTFTTGQPTLSGHNHVAWLSSRGGTRDVWLMNPDGSAPRQLTAGLAPVSAFDVTLDGATVAVAAGGEVRTMAIDGSTETLVTQDGRFEYAPRFSPDGRFVLVARREADGSDVGWWLLPAQPGVGGERRVLDSGAPPLGSTSLGDETIADGAGFPAWAGRAAWDPDGRWILVTTGTGEVVLVDLDAADPDAAVLQTGLTAGGPGAWVASGARFVVVGRDATATDDGLYTVDTAGVAERRADATGSVVAAPDGTVVFLERGDGDATRLVLGDVEGDVPARPLTDDPALADRWPAFSPDRRTIVFGRVRANGPGTSAGIWTVGAEGGPPVALTTEGAYPRWLP